MTPEVRQRLFDATLAFDHPVTTGVTIALVAVFAITPLIVIALVRAGKVDQKLRTELMLRYRSWLILTPMIFVPVLLGAFWTMFGVCILSLLCYREFARATGLFREKMVSLMVTIGIILLALTELDNWYRLFVALFPITISAIAMAAILRDQPKGYIQRVALGVLGFTLFGACMGNLGYIANDDNYRPILVLIFLAVELNDIFAFITGKTLGKRKLIPNTSPNKTVAGALGAILLTTLLVFGLGRVVFEGTVLQRPAHLIVLGVMISILGQFGDLMLSSVKRDLGIKDMSALIPGHGGLLDRFDSIILVAPAVFHYVNYFVGIGNDQPTHIFTGG